MPTEKLTAQFVALVYCPEGKSRIDYYDEFPRVTDCSVVTANWSG